MKAQIAKAIAQIVKSSSVPLTKKQIYCQILDKRFSSKVNYISIMVSNFILIEEDGLIRPGVLCDAYIKSPFVFYWPYSYANAKYEFEVYKALQKRIVDVLKVDNPFEAILHIQESERVAAEIEARIRK